MPRHPWNDTRPFALGPERSSIGFLLIHGFTGAPPEVRPLAEQLARAGHRCVGVQLPGHGTRVEALRNVTAADWIAAVRDGRRWLEERCDQVVVVGLSMGALLGVLEAVRARPAGLVLLAPAFRIANPLIALVPYLGWLPGSIPAPSESGLTSPTGWKALWHYERRPFRAARELHRLSQRAWDELPHVECPTLVVQGARDKSLRTEGAREALERLTVRSKRLVWLEHSGHIVTADVQAPVVLDEVLAFARSLQADQGSV